MMMMMMIMEMDGDGDNGRRSWGLDWNFSWLRKGRVVIFECVGDC